MRNCEVKGEKAYFHRWVDKSEIVAPSMMIGGYDGGVVRATFAIIEFEDGRVEECYPHEVVFKDNGEKWCYRYGMWMVEQCDVCESCLKAEHLQWNEGDE